MKLIISIVLAICLALVTAAFAAQTEGIDGYTKKDGKQVKPYKKTKPNPFKLDNFGTDGNVNPYTGKKGTKRPWK
jgi:hypothetical protein